ncbi:NAD(P)-binding protein [Favolaschia claudopus]|uniref:NAD(P)-binding protein n=1 Tax=Favolaschia claudopus TaxID=2862362 RepID=A0AAW0AZI2_9AGAR
MAGMIALILNLPQEKTDAEPSLRQLKFGCLGAAKITPEAIVQPARTHPEVVVYAVAARDSTRAEEYAKKHGFQKSYGGPNAYQDLIDDAEVDVVYIPLPNEPATDTAAEAEAIFSLAARKNLVVLEAFHYRFHPAIQRVKAILDSQELGAVKTAPRGTAPEGDIRWSYELGGGSTMDPGCYTVNVLRYLASCNPPGSPRCEGRSLFSRPEHKQVDKMFWATLSMEKEIVGELHSNLDEPKIIGIIPRIPKLSAIKAHSFEGTAKGEDWWDYYRYQLEAFVDKVQGRVPQTWVDGNDTVANMKWVEAIYAKDGFGSRPASKYVYHEDTKY